MRRILATLRRDNDLRALRLELARASEQLLADRASERASHDATLATLRHELAQDALESRGELSRLKGYVESLHRTLEAQTSDLVALHSTIGGVQEENRELRERSKAQRIVIGELRERIVTLEAQSARLAEDLAAARNQGQQWRSMYELVDAENRELRDELAVLKASQVSA